MTREQAKELLPIIQAFAEGEIIQYKNFLDEWTDIEENEGLSFICLPSDYRIKPQPKYRPFETKEECWNEMLKHQPFGWLREKASKKEVVHIGHVFEVEDDVLITLSINEGINNNSSYFFNEYTFEDGTPFGIKEE